MQKNPIYQFDTELSTGIENVPNEAFVLIQNFQGNGLRQVFKIGHTGLVPGTTLDDFINLPALWIELSVNGIPDEFTHKGESLSTVGGITGDTDWTPTLTTPSKLYEDLLIPDDPDVNHILAGPFDTNSFVLDVPASTTVTIV